MGLIQLLGFDHKPQWKIDESNRKYLKSKQYEKEARERKFIRKYKKWSKTLTFEEIAINLILNTPYYFTGDWLTWYLDSQGEKEKILKYEEIEYTIILFAVTKYYERLEELQNSPRWEKLKQKRKDVEIEDCKWLSFPDVENFIADYNKILRKDLHTSYKTSLLNQYLKFSLEEIREENPIWRERRLEEEQEEKELGELELKKSLLEKEMELLEVQLKLKQHEEKLKGR